MFWHSTTLHSRVRGNSSTTGASTFSLFTAWRPLRSNLSAILLPLAMPKKSAASMWGMSATLRVKAIRSLMFWEVLWSSSMFRATMLLPHTPPQAMFITSTVLSAL